MKKIYFCGLFLLSGCAIQPEYYLHSQNISLEGLPGYTDVLYQDKKLKPQFGSMDDEDQTPNFNQQNFQLSRSWDNQELIIRKKGFYDYHLKLDSVLTSEPWATAEYLTDERAYFPVLGLLVPTRTIKEVISAPSYLVLSVFSLLTFSPVDFTEYSIKTGISLINIPKDVVLDLYNIISVPGTTLINPWTEFDYNHIIILEPTEQLKQLCAIQNGAFISNDGCLACTDTSIVLYATEEECAKCPNRQWDKGKCLIK